MELNGKSISESDLVDILIVDSLSRNAQHYGIEMLEQKIKELYVNMPECRDRMLAVYNRMYKGK